MVDELLKSEFKVQSVFATKDWENPVIENEKFNYILKSSWKESVL